MSYSSTPPRSYQIDVVGEVGAAYRAVFDRLQLVGEMALLPFLITLALEIAAHFLISQGGMPVGVILAILLGIAQAVFAIVFIVRWYRFLLLDETVGGGLIPPGWTASIVVTVKLVLLIIAALVPLMIIGMIIPILGAPLSLIGGIAVGLASVRVSMIFPAAAIEQPIPFRTAWDWLEGNYWRLVAVEFACYVPFVVAGYVLRAIASELPSLFYIVIAALQLLVSFVGWAVISAVLAHVYRELTGVPRSA
ncbi:MAG TPA: hypothetical protein VK432_01185 [Stellaceae bacterium]|nr:hypothetical protein [Stellaceae bacterium]